MCFYLYTLFNCNKYLLFSLQVSLKAAKVFFAIYYIVAYFGFVFFFYTYNL